MTDTITVQGDVHIHTTARRSGRPRNPDLTDRECEVLIYLSKGFTNRQIGYLIGVTTNTTTDHVKNIFRKLGVGSRAEAAVCATKAGLV